LAYAGDVNFISVEIGTIKEMHKCYQMLVRIERAKFMEGSNRASTTNELIMEGCNSYEKK
jgi:hypothetical protein